MIRLSVAIMAHSSRREQATGLAAAVGGASIAWDEATGGRSTAREWANGAAAWRQHDPHASHHLVLQDDAVPSPNLVPVATGALARATRGDLVSLYYGWTGTAAGRNNSHGLVQRGATLAQRQQASWIITGAWWGVALIMPVGAIGGMLAWCHGRTEPYDMRIARWARAAGRNVWHTWPSLVDHQDGPSIVRPGRKPGRRAWRFIGTGSFDPAGPVVTLTAASKRPQSMTVRRGLASHAGRSTSAREGRMNQQRSSGLHDPYRVRDRQQQLSTYLNRRRARRAQRQRSDLHPGIAPLPPLPLPLVLPPPSLPDMGTGQESQQPEQPAVETIDADLATHGRFDENQPVGAENTEATEASEVGPVEAAAALGTDGGAPPTSGPGSATPAWRSFIQERYGKTPDEVAALSRPQLIAIHTGAD